MKAYMFVFVVILMISIVLGSFTARIGSRFLFVVGEYGFAAAITGEPRVEAANRTRIVMTNGDILGKKEARRLNGMGVAIMMGVILVSLAVLTAGVSKASPKIGADLRHFLAPRRRGST
jgi:hypothetical protein